MKTTTAPRAAVVGSTSPGGNVTRVWVRCPYCAGIHAHAWLRRDELGVRHCTAGTPSGPYLVIFTTQQRQGDSMPGSELYRTRADSNELVLTPAAKGPDRPIKACVGCTVRWP